MRKKMRVGKATDGLMGGQSKKPRHYAEIDDNNGESIVAKIYTHNPDRNPQHEARMKKGLRKPIKRFGKDSVLDRSLFKEKVSKKPIKTEELDFEKSNFEFNEQESKSLRRFVFGSSANRKRYAEWKNRQKTRTNRVQDPTEAKPYIKSKTRNEIAKKKKH